MKKSNLYLCLMLAIVAAALVVGCKDSNTTTANAGADKEPAPASQSAAAPAFTVQTIDGITISTEDNKAAGRPMVVYFMSSTCATCAKNWKNMDEVYPQYKEKIDLVAISVDPTDDRELLAELAAEKGFTFHTVEGNPQLAIQYKVTKQTAKFAIDGQGNISYRHDGVLSAQEWQELFESLI